MDDQNKAAGHTVPPPPLQKPQVKPARQTHYLQRLRPSGLDGRLADVAGSAIALLSTSHQTEAKQFLLKESKKQFRAEIEAAFAAVDA